MPQSRIWEAFQRQGKVSTDTRKIEQGAIFFALKGGNFDGNAFAAQALEAGAAFAVVDDPSVMPAADARYILVPDVLRALQDLGLAQRRSFSIPVIGVTGSNGKTTTKELLHAVLSAERKAYATTGNLNNHIGVPLTLLAMPRDTEIAVIEMGANKPKDIEELVNIALPTHGLITNVGNAHLEGMGGIEGVQRTKGEMFDFLRAHAGCAFVNEGDARVAAEAYDLKEQVGYGGPQSAYRILQTDEDDTKQTILIATPKGNLEVTTQLLGRHNADNVLLAVAAGQYFGISDEAIQAAIARYAPRMNRSQLHQQAGRTYLLDAYNANPSSMEATIRSIALHEHASVALVLGDMFELGPSSAELHAGIWKLSRQVLPTAKIIGIGPTFHANMPANDALMQSFPSMDAAKEGILAALDGYEFVLLKGSRGMALERLYASLGITL